LFVALVGAEEQPPQPSAEIAPIILAHGLVADRAVISPTARFRAARRSGVVKLAASVSRIHSSRRADARPKHRRRSLATARAPEVIRVLAFRQVANRRLLRPHQRQRDVDGPIAARRPAPSPSKQRIGSSAIFQISASCPR